MHKDLQKPSRKGVGIFDRHTRGYVEDFCEAFMRKGSVCRSSKKSLNLGVNILAKKIMFLKTKLMEIKSKGHTF